MKIKLLILLTMCLVGTTSVFAGSNCDITLPSATTADGKTSDAGTVNACLYEGKSLDGFSDEDVATLNKTLAKCKCDIDNKEITQKEDGKGAHCSSGRIAKTVNGKTTIERTEATTVTKD